MGREEEEEEEEPKAKLVKEICFVSMAFASCEHRRPNADVFVDWYLVLKVGEDCGLELIRHRYRELALQLHPDKNKHPKAETAFKLISEAYACLSDKSRRKAFNGERATNFCKLCYQSWRSGNGRISSSKGSEKSKNSKKPKPARQQQSAANRTKRNHIAHKLKQLQSRFREECRVIESYLKATVNTTRRESPLFDPYNLTMFPNYPYQRPAMAAAAAATNAAAWGQAHCESPVYQIRSDCWARRPPKPPIF